MESWLPRGGAPRAAVTKAWKQIPGCSSLLGELLAGVWLPWAVCSAGGRWRNHSFFSQHSWAWAIFTHGGPELLCFAQSMDTSWQEHCCAVRPSQTLEPDESTPEFRPFLLWLYGYIDMWVYTHNGNYIHLVNGSLMSSFNIWTACFTSG